MRIMRSKQWFIVLFASIIAGCSLNTVDECPIWLDVNDTDFYSADNDADGDKTNNCWDVCPYNNQVNAFYTKEMVMAHPIDASEWVYVCNLNVPISESDFSSSFAFNEEYNIYHVYKASDIELYRNLAESERSQIKGMIFHNAINLAEDVESCNDLEWSPIPLPETGKFIIEGRDNAEITASDDDGTCVLSQPLFADFNHVHVNESNKVENKVELTINLNFTGKMNGGLTNQINESEIHHLTFNGTSHLEKNDQAEFGLLTGSITQSKLSDITILGKLKTQSDNISNGKIGLLAGSVSNAELNEITCYGDVISNISDAENGSVGLLSGEITDSTLNQIKLTNPATDIHSDNDNDNDNDNQKVVKYDSSIQINAPIHTTGGLAGKLSRTTIKGGSLTGLSIEANANIDYMAGLAGFMEDSSFTAEEYVTNNIRLNSQKAKPIAVGGIAGTIINQNANDTTGIKQINTQITVSNAAFVGGFAGSIETAILSDITLRKVSVTQAANSVIEHIGGVIGNMSNQSRISRSSFDDTTLTVTHAEYIGGLAGSIYDESTVEGNSFSNMTIIDTRPDDKADNTEDDTEKIIHKTGYLGGVAGYAKDSRIITTSHNILNIESVASNYTGGIAGLLSNSRIAECGITGSSEKKKENERKKKAVMIISFMFNQENISAVLLARLSTAVKLLAAHCLI